MAVIVAFPGRRKPPLPVAMPSPPALFTADWQREHMPLIEATTNLAQADDAEFARRCRLMATEDGRGLLAELSARLDLLAGHIVEVVVTPRTTATRIRGVMTTLPA